MSDIINRINNRIHDTPMPAEHLLDEAAELIESLREALAWIHNSTEPDAIRHRSYDELAAAIDTVCVQALNGEFNENMRAAEVYDEQRRHGAN